MADAEAWRRARPLLGTLVEVRFRCPDVRDADAIAGAAFDAVARYHAAMSFHEPASDVRRIAAAAAGTTLRVAPETGTVLAAALEFERLSDGVFGVAVGAELVRRGLLPAPAAAFPAPAGAASALRLDADDRVTVLRPVWIDLGGIAKGAAVDAALAVLRAAGATAAAVNAGGDLALHGPAEPVWVRGPGGVTVRAGTLAGGAIATSGPFGAGGALVLPAGRTAWRSDCTVSVVAPSCLLADALTKVVAALGPDAKPLLARHDAHAFVVGADARLQRL